MAINAIVKFLSAARSLVDQGMSKEAIMNFAKNEFGEINELFQKQIDNLFKPKQGIENIQIKDEVFDDTVVKLPLDDTGQPFNPNDPLKQYGKPKISIEGQMEKINKASKRLDELMKEREEMFKPKKPRDEKYTGGMVDVEPSLSDIGHGSDALMARTRLVSPNSQATTSTGLNYLLAEDNDNIRVPFSKGKLADAARRKFMKTAGAAGAGIAALKTGLIGLGEKAAPVAKEVIETVSETAQGVPPYFLNLVNKIRKMGESTLATKDKANAYKFKDYVMEEDFAGNIEIIKKGDNVAEDVYMSYKVDDVSLKDKKGFAKVDEYEEFTATPDAEGKMKNIEQGVPDEVVQEGTMFEDNITEFGKAEGGRIGFSAGSLAKLGITGSSRRFLEKVFGKEGLETMIKRDPEMHRGLLEVVEMFRNRDKEGLKMYMQKFLPHMDDATVEDFIIGDSSTEGIAGQLIRLGSGRDYKAKMDMIKKADDVRKLDNLEVTEEMVRKPNASGGLAKMLGE